MGDTKFIVRSFLIVVIVSFLACEWGVSGYLESTRSRMEPESIECRSLIDRDTNANRYVAIGSYTLRYDGSVSYDNNESVWVPLTPGNDDGGHAVLALAWFPNAAAAQSAPNELTGMLTNRGVNDGQLIEVLEDVNPGIDVDQMWLFHSGVAPSPPTLAIVAIFFGIFLSSGLAYIYLPVGGVAQPDARSTVGLVLLATGLLGIMFLGALLVLGADMLTPDRFTRLGLALGLMASGLSAVVGTKVMQSGPPPQSSANPATEPTAETP